MSSTINLASSGIIPQAARANSSMDPHGMVTLEAGEYSRKILQKQSGAHMVGDTNPVVGKGQIDDNHPTFVARYRHGTRGSAALQPGTEKREDVDTAERSVDTSGALVQVPQAMDLLSRDMDLVEFSIGNQHWTMDLQQQLAVPLHTIGTVGTMGTVDSQHQLVPMLESNTRLDPTQRQAARRRKLMTSLVRKMKERRLAAAIINNAVRSSSRHQLLENKKSCTRDGGDSQRLLDIEDCVEFCEKRRSNSAPCHLRSCMKKRNIHDDADAAMSTRSAVSPPDVKFMRVEDATLAPDEDNESKGVGQDEMNDTQDLEGTIEGGHGVPSGRVTGPGDTTPSSVPMPGLHMRVQEEHVHAGDVLGPGVAEMLEERRRRLLDMQRVNFNINGTHGNDDGTHGQHPEAVISYTIGHTEGRHQQPEPWAMPSAGT